jgi:hypothetical protein
MSGTKCSGVYVKHHLPCPKQVSQPAAVSAGYRPVETYPVVLFDGYAVYQAMTDEAKARTSPENVSDVLDAVADLIRQDLQKR